MPEVREKMKAGREEEDSLPPAEKYTRGRSFEYALNLQHPKTKMRESPNQVPHSGPCMEGKPQLEMDHRRRIIQMIFVDAWTIA